MGERTQMTTTWKASVRDALRRRGAAEQWLADRLTERLGRRIKRDTVNKMLNRQHTSALVGDVCEILGLPLPMIETPSLPDEETRREIELFLAEPPDVRRAVLLLLGRRSGLR